MELHETALSILPPKSRAKFERFVADRDAAHVVVRSTSDALQAARHDFQLLDARVREQLGGFHGIEVLSPGQAFRRGAAEAAKTEAEERMMQPVVTAERRRDLAADAHERAVAAWERFAFVGEVERWLERMARLGAPRLEHYAPAAPKDRDALAEVQKLRGQLAELDEAWRQAEQAPAPPEVLRAQALAEIDRLAATGALKLHPADRSDTPLHLDRAIRITQVPVRLPGDTEPRTALTGNGGGPLLIWLVRDQLRAEVEKLTAGLPPEGTLTDDQRDREFSRISVRRLELERAEEALIVAMEAEGRIVQRRRDADPRAILEVSET